MSYCPHCGTQLPRDAQFCTSCGRPLSAPETKPGALRPLAAILAVLVVALGVVIALIVFRGQETLEYDDCMALAARYLEELDFEQAEAMYLEAIQLDPSQVEAYRALAELYISQERFEEAVDLLMRGLSETGGEQLQVRLDELLPRMTYDHCLTLAAWYLDREDTSRAETAYLAAIALDGSGADSYRALAGLYISLGRTGDALDLLIQGHAVTGSTALLAMLDGLLSDLSYQQFLTLAAYHLEREDSGRAETVYLAAIALDGSQVGAYRALAELYISLGRTEDAIDLLERGIAQTGSSMLEEMLRRLLPTATDLRSFLGLSYFDYEEAGLAYVDSVEGISLDYGDISYDIRSDSSGALLTFLCDDGDTAHLPVRTVSASLDDSGTSYSACGAVLGMAQGAVPDAIHSSGGTVEQTYNSGLRASDADDTIIFVHFSDGVVDYLVVSTLVDDRTGYFFRDLAPMYARESSLDLYPLRNVETPFDFANEVNGTWHNSDGTDDWSGFSAPYGTITTLEGDIDLVYIGALCQVSISDNSCTDFYSIGGVAFGMGLLDAYIILPTHGFTYGLVDISFGSYRLAWHDDTYFIDLSVEDDRLTSISYMIIGGYD